MVKKKVRKITTRQLAIEAARIAHDRHGEDVVVLDLRGISPVADYFVIFTGTSERQMSAVADEIAETAARSGHKAIHVAGLGSNQPARRSSGGGGPAHRSLGGGGWILLDFFDVVVHVFDDEHRKYYDLELIWGDAPRIRWKKPCKKTK